jgi:large subunit ribosomal protein L9
MKIVLTQDVRGTGKKGDVVEVSDGFARNYLLPKKLGVEATVQNVHAAQRKKAADVHRGEQQQQHAQRIADEIEGQTFVLKAKAGEGGRLFGAITAREIGEAITARFDIDLDKKRIVLPENIKRLGRYEVEIKPYANVSSKIIVEIEGQ